MIWIFKTIYYQLKYLTKLSNWEKIQHLKFLWIFLLLLFGKKIKKKTNTNTFFNLNEILSFSHKLRQILFFHNKFLRVLLDPKQKGIRDWEYGLFLSKTKLKKGIKVLDLGAGSSALPYYLHSQGLNVTAFDLEDPLEKPLESLSKKYPTLKYDRGTLTKLPYQNNSFDLVICITTIEHLDYNFKLKKPFSYTIFLQRTKISLSEIVRVLKKGGRLFITSDLYFPRKQQTDNYSQAYFYQGFRPIGAAFKAEDFSGIFLDTLQKLGCKLVGSTNYNFGQLEKDINRANFRGRFFTTFSLYAEKT